MRDEAGSISMTTSETSQLLAKLTTKGMIVLVVLAIVAAVQMVSAGLTMLNLISLVGAVASLIIIFWYITRIVRSEGLIKSSLKQAALTLCVFVPYFYGLYVVFVKGLWHFHLLFASSPAVVSIVTSALLYTVAGYAVVKALYEATEFNRAVNTGRVRIVP